MKRTVVSYPINDDSAKFKQKLILWSKNYREVVALDSNEHTSEAAINFIIALDAITLIQSDDIKQIKEYQTTLNDWCFGFITYDVKNQIYQLQSKNTDVLSFPEMAFFQPKKLIRIEGKTVTFEYLAFCDDEIADDFEEIKEQELFFEKRNPITLTPRTTFENYDKNFQKAKKYIERGDTYELNYCIEFYANNIEWNPYGFYNQLNEKAKTPFASFLKWNKHYALCASPERFLKNVDRKITAQPIKGTAKRGTSLQEDEDIKKELENNKKERTENIMIVDLVRNDLATIAKPNSLVVEELCKIYTFPAVHQMISKVSCTLSEDIVTPIDAVFYLFPMASMTGVPKKSTLEIIEEIEEHKRGLYSGSIGYFAPNGDFDFNVVIRTLLYNQEEKYLSLSVGSAITFEAVSTYEYNECLLKAKAIQELLKQNDDSSTV